MDRGELLRKINTFPLIAEELARDLLAGDFRSVFRGEGIEFDEVRLYEQGDDVRAIDRNVSARYGKPYVNLYREERELTVFILLDCSASMFVGSVGSGGSGGSGGERSLSRFDQALLASVLIAFSANRSGQRLGALIFDNATRHIFKPRKGRAHIMALTSAALRIKPLERGTNLATALAGAGRLLKRRSIIVIVSDFSSVGWEEELGHLSEKHDCIACRIFDPIDVDFPNVGLVSIEDPETGKTISAGAGYNSFRAAWAEHNAERAALWSHACRRTQTAQLELSTAQDAVSVIKNFFRSRRHRVP
jgi:uncharacterized protein (DUF58 family)